MKIRSILVALYFVMSIIASAAPTDFNFRYAENKSVYLDSDVDQEDLSMSGAPLNLLAVSLRMMYPEQLADRDISALQLELTQKSGIDFVAGELSLAEPPTPTATLTDLLSDTPCGQSLDLNAYVSTLTGDLAVWTISGYWFMGGAHGMPICKYLNYSVKRNAILTYDNLFKSGFRTVTNRAIREYLIDNPNDYLQTPINEIETPDAFRINPDGSITFVFMPYEIAAYAAGFIEVPVDAWDLKDILTPLGKEIMMPNQ